VGLLLGIIVHELGHYLVALALGWRVDGLSRPSLLSLGINIEHPEIGSESVRVLRQKVRAITVAGPASNLITGLLLSLLEASFGGHLQLSPSKTGFVMMLGVVQLALGISNLIPAEKGTILGNDGNILFRICRNDESYEQALVKLAASENKSSDVSQAES
jgi:hypothetical protein